MKLTAEFKFANLSLLIGFFLAPAYASFEPLPVGGRAAGMGEAYSAIADDVFSVYYNPAGILQINRPEFGTYYSRLFVGLDDNSEISRSFFGYGQPVGKGGKWGGMGVSYMALDLPGLYKEEVFGLTYGQEYRRLCNIGATIKVLKKAIGTDEYSNNAINPSNGAATGTADPLLAKNRSASGIGLDFGLQYLLTRSYAVGFSARNLNAPDVALGSEKDAAPTVLALGLARRLRSGSLDFEIMNWKSVDNNIRLVIGGEHWFKGGFGLRAGGGFGSRSYSSLSLGASYKMESIQFDYATIYPLQGVSGTLGTQQISLIVRLGKPPVDPIEKQLLKEKEERVRAETEARAAKAERDRLKAQLIVLTEEKTQVEKAEEQRAAQRAIENAAREANRPAREAAPAPADRTNLNRYTAALADYNAKVTQGISLIEKRALLEKIIADFGGRGINISTVERELKSLKNDEAKAKKDFDLSMTFYRRLVQQGASVEERRSMLERIIQKYKGAGIDVQAAQDEINGLK